jgi:hypothetical protein
MFSSASLGASHLVGYLSLPLARKGPATAPGPNRRFAAVRYDACN